MIISNIYSESSKESMAYFGQSKFFTVQDFRVLDVMNFKRRFYIELGTHSTYPSLSLAKALKAS